MDTESDITGECIDKADGSKGLKKMSLVKAVSFRGKDSSQVVLSKAWTTISSFSGCMGRGGDNKASN